MADDHDSLMAAIANEDVVAVERIVESGIDLNVPCDQGATVLFGAVLHGNTDICHTLLVHGADPNFRAGEPACDVYAPKPLDLAMQARFLMDSDKSSPVVELLQRFGATDSDGE